MADINILAHPGAITKEDALVAKEKGIFLELTARRGHSQGNTHVAEIARATGAKLVINNDAHTPENIISAAELRNVGVQAGLSESEINRLYTAEKEFLENIL